MGFLADNQQVEMHPLTGCVNTRELRVYIYIYIYICGQKMCYEAGDRQQKGVYFTSSNEGLVFYGQESKD